MKLVWDESAWDNYLHCQQEDRRILKRINTLLKDIVRNGNEGIGKPEPLKYGFLGYWSRRITDEHRLVYRVADDEIRIAAFTAHRDGSAAKAGGGYQGLEQQTPRPSPAPETNRKLPEPRAFVIGFP